MAAMQMLPPLPESTRGLRKARSGRDSVPAMLTPGEFVLPPDTVARLGGAAGVQALVNATHQKKKARADMAHAPRGFRPEVLFANGGPVPGNEKEEKRRHDALVAQIPRDADIHAPPAQEQYRSGARLGGVAQGAREDVADAWGRGHYAQAAGLGLRGAMAAVPASFMDAGSDIARAAAPAVRGVQDFGRGLLGMPSRAQAETAASADDGQSIVRTPLAKSSVPALNIFNRTLKRSAGAPQNVPPAGQGAAEPAAAEIAPGIYRHARGQYSDTPEGMGFGLRRSGRPNAQNMRAADNLAQHQQGLSAVRIAAQNGTASGAYAGGMPQAPQLLHAGNDWTAANALRNARVAASSIKNTERWGGKGASKDNPALQNYEALLQADTQARAGQAPLAQEALRQGGESSRAHMAANLAGQRLGLDAQRLGMEQQQASFGLRSAALRERLNQRLAAAKSPEEREAVIDLMGQLFGSGQQKAQNPAQRYIKLGAGKKIDPQTGMAEDLPDILFDAQEQRRVQF